MARKKLTEGVFPEGGRGRKQCPKCESFIAAGSKECPSCGRKFRNRKPKPKKRRARTVAASDNSPDLEKNILKLALRAGGIENLKKAVGSVEADLK